MTDLTKDWLDDLLVPLFVQARQEALKEAYEIPLNRDGIVTSTPTKVHHLVIEAEQAITDKLREERMEAYQMAITDAIQKTMGQTDVGLARQAIAELRKETS